MRALIILSLMMIAAACSDQRQTELPHGDAIDEKVRALMAAEDVKGLGLAVIDEGEIIHLASYGYRNVEKRLSLDTNTIMYGASLTKTAFAYMVLQLVDEGVFDLDRPLADYLAKPLPDYEDYADLAGDERWRQLTGRHVFNHAAGFANFRWLEDGRKLRFNFDPGARYAYSGEGFYLLQFVLEEGLGFDVKEEMQIRIFDRFAMPDTSMQWRVDFAENLADGYDINGEFEVHDERSNVSAAGSMDTTISDQANMWAGIVSGDSLSRAAREELVRPQLPITSASQFPTLSERTDPRTNDVGLSAGLGVVRFEGAKGPAWYKGGHNDITGNLAICQELERRCIVLLSNSVRAELIYPDLVQFILDDPLVPLWWEYAHVK